MANVSEIYHELVRLGAKEGAPTLQTTPLSAAIPPEYAQKQLRHQQLM